jgi:tetratricopeptide (TPR) repeat protein
MSRRSPRNARARIARLQRRIERNPNCAGLYQSLGKAYHDSGRLDLAEAAFSTSVELDPNDPWSHLYLGNALCSREQHSQGLAMFQRASELAPELSMTWVSIADAHTWMGDLERAGEYYLRAVETDPSDSIANDNLKRWLKVVSAGTSPAS